MLRRLRWMDIDTWCLAKWGCPWCVKVCKCSVGIWVMTTGCHSNSRSKCWGVADRGALGPDYLGRPSLNWNWSAREPTFVRWFGWRDERRMVFVHWDSASVILWVVGCLMGWSSIKRGLWDVTRDLSVKWELVGLKLRDRFF